MIVVDEAENAIKEKKGGSFCKGIKEIKAISLVDMLFAFRLR